MTPRLFVHVLTMETRKILAYRANFWISALLSFVVQIGVLYFVWQAVFRESGKAVIGGYTFAQMLTYYVLVMLLGKLVRGAEQLGGGVSDEIYQGTLTRYLLYPANYFLFKYAQHLGLVVPALAQLVVFGACCAWLLDVERSLALTPATLAMTFGAVAAGNLLSFLLFWPLESVAFWQDNVWSLSLMMRFFALILGGAMLPLSVFPEWSRQALALLPFRYLYAFPADILMGKVALAEWATDIGVCLAWGAVLGLVSRWMWRRGSLEYTGVGI